MGCAFLEGTGAHGTALACCMAWIPELLRDLERKRDLDHGLDVFHLELLTFGVRGKLGTFFRHGIRMIIDVPLEAVSAGRKEMTHAQEAFGILFDERRRLPQPGPDQELALQV
jgi:hypothetical protein